MRTFKPLWHEGLILTPQHFQQQEQWLNVAHRQFASLAIAEPWGIVDVQLDEDTLAVGRLALTRLKLRLPDGTLIDSSATDVLPRPRDLSRDIAPDVQSVVVLAALPLLNADGSNCRFDDETLSRPRRYFREFVEVPDLNGTGVEELSVERHAVHLLFDFEPHADDVVCPVARLVRGARGQFEMDRVFVPPCLTLAAHERHRERVARLSDILLAKSTALAARRGERIDQIAEFGVADVSLFWLLHCIHTHWPKLSFLGTHPNQPPERLYEVLATFTGALMTFSTGTALTAIPPYEHAKQDDILDACALLLTAERIQRAVQTQESLQHRRQQEHARSDVLVFVEINGDIRSPAKRHARLRIHAAHTGAARDANDACDLFPDLRVVREIVQPQDLLKRVPSFIDDRKMVQREMRDQPPLYRFSLRRTYSFRRFGQAAAL